MAPPLDFHWKRSCAGRPLRMRVGRPPRVPHDRRGGNLGPVGVRGPSDRRYDYPAPGSSRQPHVRGSRKARRGPGPRRRRRDRRGRVQRRAPAHDALPARTRSRRGMLRPSAGLAELFAQRASSREGKLQVELALLQYEVPLLREWIHEADIGERPGFMAGGEQRVDAYLETVKRRIKRIRDELESIRRGREARRTLRKERGYHLVALAGYANAGKTSLLNALADERLLVEDRMFSTLSTATRSLTGTRKRILLTDTIGFVDGVPFWMVEAFNATLEEILQADLVLLLVDVSDSEDEIRRKVRLAARTLFPKVSADSVRPVLTK